MYYLPAYSQQNDDVFIFAVHSTAPIICICSFVIPMFMGIFLYIAHFYSVHFHGIVVPVVHAGSMLAQALQMGAASPANLQRRKRYSISLYYHAHLN